MPLLPEECAFSFLSEHDFTLHGALGHTFNHWLFSRLLEARWPAAWRKEILPPVQRAYGQKPSAELKHVLRRWARRQVLRLPFPRLKGMSLWQSLRFSVSLLHMSYGEDRSQPLAATFGSAATARAPICRCIPCPFS